MKLSDIQSEYSQKTKSNRSQVKLLPHVINIFDGNTTQWKSFYDSFNAAVHYRDLSIIDKFNYLKGYLDGDALKTVGGLALTYQRELWNSIELIRRAIWKWVR